MAQSTSIEWTQATWNPVTGCTKVSPGCKHCYAARMANRLEAMGQPRYANGFRVTLQHDLVELPLSWRKPRKIFVNSMSDLFHDAVPIDFIRRVFSVMESAGHHQFQVLTKRAERLHSLRHVLPWPRNVWMGVSVENERYLERVSRLAEVPAAVRFLSLEPLLGPLPFLPLENIDWVIVGGESGPGARPMHAEWVREIRSQCREWGVPFFFKQWGGTRKARTGRTLDGKIWDEFPHPPLGGERRAPTPTPQSRRPGGPPRRRPRGGS
jgi:protein gp37